MKNEKVFELYKKCLRIRLIEEAIAEIYPTDKVQSPVHFSNGQEAISVGICENLNNSDLAFGTYRGHALYLAKGGNLNEMMAELYGKQTGCGKGKSGSMHLSAKEVGLMGTSAIVSSTIPHAVGAALAAKIRKTEQVTVCFLGDGATGEGVYHECLNFASNYQLPILFVCENNDLSIFTKTSDTHSYDICEHAGTYDIKSEKIYDGWDVNLINDRSQQAIDYIKQQKRPYLIEIITCRYLQHVGPGQGLDKETRVLDEIKRWQTKDPLIIHDELFSEYKDIVNKEINVALKFADNSNFPTEEHLYKDVF